MRLIAELKIPKMFTAYAEDLGYLDHNRLHHVQYFCEACYQIFSAAWGRRSGMGHHERGDNFRCARCGTQHEKNVVYLKRSELAPDKMRLAVKEYKSAVTFEIYSTTLEFNNYLGIFERSYKEVFRFDIDKQTATFTTYRNGAKCETLELGDPFKLDIFQKSILRFFLSFSFANTDQKTELSRILKVLRETVHRKLEEHLGYKVSSMFVFPGTYYGSFLVPIFNIAYRLACPDAPNLPAVYREDTRTVWDYWTTKMLEVSQGVAGTLIHTFSGAGYMDGVMAKTRKKKDFITALAASHSLPDKPMVRRALQEDPFDVNMLSMSFKLCENYDYAMQMFGGMTKLKHMRDHEELLQFLQEMKGLYGEVGIVRLVCEAQELNLRDCIRLYEQLNDANKKALADEGVRLRDLHDWMSLRQKKQLHKNVKFDVPAHIVRRLSMQRDRLSFFLPAESMQLLEAGHKLHNCVAGYGKSMKNNELWIVLVADDMGKLAACLEIKGKELVQAKQDRNKAVSLNAQLNDAIFAWAKAAKLEIKTSDVRVPKEKKTKIKIPA